jgi:cation diffusion facilitator family transporter
MEIKDKQRQQILATRVSIYASVVLFLIAAIAGIAVDSITLILDASSNLVILVAAFLTHFSIKKIHMPADDSYNFGYGKYESFSVVLQGGLIITACVVSMKFAVQDVIHADDIHGYGLPVIATFISGIIGIFVLCYIKKVAVHTNSSILKTAGLHWRTDTIFSFGVCAGFLCGFILKILGFNKVTPYLDPVMAIMLAIIFIKAPVNTIVHNISELLDAVPEGEVRSKINKVVDIHKSKFSGVHRFRTRKAGEKIFVDVGFLIKGSLSITEAEKLASDFEQELKEHVPACDVIVYFKSAK